MTALWCAALGFAALHLLVSATGLRDRLVKRLGIGPYMGLFSLLSAAGLGAMIWAYLRVRVPEISAWPELRGWVHVGMVPAFLLMALGLTTPSPTLAGGTKHLHGACAPSGIHRLTRHPFLWGISVWAALHWIYNPGLAHGIFFGTFIVVALVGTLSIDRKRALSAPAEWQRYLAQTSNLPLLAILQGRTPWVWREVLTPAAAVAVAVYAAVLMLHGKFFGMPLV